jgi:hypothetical protein
MRRITCDTGRKIFNTYTSSGRTRKTRFRACSRSSQASGGLPYTLSEDDLFSGTSANFAAPINPMPLRRGDVSTFGGGARRRLRIALRLAPAADQGENRHLHRLVGRRRANAVRNEAGPTCTQLP